MDRTDFERSGFRSAGVCRGKINPSESWSLFIYSE